MKNLIITSLVMATVLSMAQAQSDLYIDSLSKLRCNILSMKRTDKNLGPFGMNIFGKTKVVVDDRDVNQDWSPTIYEYETENRFALNFVASDGEYLGWGYFDLLENVVIANNKKILLQDESQGKFEVNLVNGKARYTNSQKMGGFPLNDVTRTNIEVKLDNCKID